MPILGHLRQGPRCGLQYLALLSSAGAWIGADHPLRDIQEESQRLVVQDAGSHGGDRFEHLLQRQRQTDIPESPVPRRARIEEIQQQRADKHVEVVDMIDHIPKST